MGFMTSNYITYSISFLELQPKYICTYQNGTDYACKNTDFCGTTIPHRINYTDNTSLQNWVEDLDLYCTPGAQIGLIGSMFFAGWAVSATILPRTADIYGRKRVYLFAMIGHLIFYLGEILSRNIKLTTGLQFFLGAMSVGRATVGYLYTLELVPLNS
jgi:MFS family permease